MNSKTLRDEQR